MVQSNRPRAECPDLTGSRQLEEVIPHRGAQDRAHAMAGMQDKVLAPPTENRVEEQRMAMTAPIAINVLSVRWTTTVSTIAWVSNGLRERSRLGG